MIDKIMLAMILLVIVLLIIYLRVRKMQKASGWGAFFKPEEKKYFLHLISEYFNNKSISATIADGVIQIEGSSARMGLGNIAQICHHEKTTEWARLIEEHFNKLLEIMHSESKFEEMIKDFSRISSSLAVRLYPEEYIQTVDHETMQNMVYREDIEGAITVLVYDLPETVRTVRLTDIKLWNKEVPELFKIGLENVKKNCVVEKAELDLNDNLKVVLLSGESMFVASCIFFIEEFTGCVGKHGALIGIPHRHALLSYPIENLSVVDAIRSMITVVHGMYEEGPGSISSKIYWYHAGKFINLPYVWDKHRVEFSPPDEFTDLLNKLGSDPRLPFAEWRK